MRTDAKIGFAIGAVLLAVLTVYAIVVPKKRTVSSQGVAIVTPKGLSNATTPSDNVTIAKVPDATPSLPDAVAPAPTKLDPTPTPPAPSGPVADATPKSPDGVDWNKLIGAPVQSTTPSNPNTPNTLYSAGPTGTGTSVSDNTTTTTTTPPAADPSTFTPGTESTVTPSSKTNRTSPVSNSNESTGTGHSKTTPTHKTARTHDTEVAARTPGNGTQYVVEAGDTLSGIAAAQYGAAHYYMQIIKANPKLDPNRMRPGTKITLPDLSQAIAAKSNDTSVADLQQPRTSIRVDTEGAAGGGVFTPGSHADTLFATGDSSSSSDSNGSYTVHAGDSLYRISKKLYGTSHMADQIFAVNKDVIGSDMSKLKLGMVLTLPEAPTN